MSIENLLFVFDQVRLAFWLKKWKVTFFYCQVFPKLTNARIQSLLADQKIDSNNYLELYCPAVDWILQCLSNNQTNKYLNEIMEKFKSLGNSIVR